MRATVLMYICACMDDLSCVQVGLIASLKNESKHEIVEQVGGEEEWVERSSGDECGGVVG